MLKPSITMSDTERMVFRNALRTPSVNVFMSPTVLESTEKKLTTIEFNVGHA